MRNQTVPFNLFIILISLEYTLAFLYWLYIMFRGALIVNLLRFQSRTPLSEQEIKRDKHFRKEKLIILIYALISVMVSCTLLYPVIMLSDPEREKAY